MGSRARSEEELQCVTGSCFCEERGFLVCHMVLKDILLLAAKILILLGFFFFQDRCYFLLEMLCMQINVVQQEKSPESNHTDKLSTLGNSCLSFIFFFSSVQDTSLLVLSYSL